MSEKRDDSLPPPSSAASDGGEEAGESTKKNNVVVKIGMVGDAQVSIESSSFRSLYIDNTCLCPII